MNGYGRVTHEKLILYYLKQGGYTGALLANIQAHTFQEGHRGENLFSKTMDDMGSYNSVDTELMGCRGRMAIKVTVHEFDSNTGKNEVICSVRAKNPVVCIFFLAGLSWFYKYVVNSCPPPTDLVPVDYVATGSPVTSTVVTATSSSSSSTATMRPQTNTTNESNVSSTSLSPLPSSSTNNVQESWRSDRFLAHKLRGHYIDPKMTIPKSSLATAIQKAHLETGASQLTSNVLHAARKASVIVMDAARVPIRFIKKQISHASRDTTEQHYANTPPIESCMALAGWHKTGSDFDPLHALARLELETDFIDIVNMIIPHSARAQSYITAHPGDLTRHAHISLLRESSFCCIESAAMLRIDGLHADLEFWKYPPFNTPMFTRFCGVLKSQN